VWSPRWPPGLRLVASDIDPETSKATGSTEHAEAKKIVAAIAGGTLVRIWLPDPRSSLVWSPVEPRCRSCGGSSA
jgi:hypothetical protein